jgi:hypothetical protein
MLKKLPWLLLLAATPVMAGTLVDESLEYVYPPGELPQPIMICKYSDGVVITVPGSVCPAFD